MTLTREERDPLDVAPSASGAAPSPSAAPRDLVVDAASLVWNDEERTEIEIQTDRLKKKSNQNRMEPTWKQFNFKRNQYSLLETIFFVTCISISLQLRSGS